MFDLSLVFKKDGDGSPDGGGTGPSVGSIVGAVSALSLGGSGS